MKKMEHTYHLQRHVFLPPTVVSCIDCCCFVFKHRAFYYTHNQQKQHIKFSVYCCFLLQHLFYSSLLLLLCWYSVWTSTFMLILLMLLFFYVVFMVKNTSLCGQNLGQNHPMRLFHSYFHLDFDWGVAVLFRRTAIFWESSKFWRL